VGIAPCPRGSLPHDAAWEAAEKEVIRQAPWIAAIDAEVRAKIAAREAALTQRHGE
jgi:hypothetical protein